MWPECGHKSGIIFFSKNRIIPQTTFVPTFWPHIISELGGVHQNQNRYFQKLAGKNQTRVIQSLILMFFVFSLEFNYHNYVEYSCAICISLTLTLISTYYTLCVLCTQWNYIHSFGIIGYICNVKAYTKVQDGNKVGSL